MQLKFVSLGLIATALIASSSVSALATVDGLNVVADHVATDIGQGARVQDILENPNINALRRKRSLASPKKVADAIRRRRIIDGNYEEDNLLKRSEEADEEEADEDEDEEDENEASVESVDAEEVDSEEVDTEDADTEESEEDDTEMKRRWDEDEDEKSNEEDWTNEEEEGEWNNEEDEEWSNEEDEEWSNEEDEEWSNEEDDSKFRRRDLLGNLPIVGGLTGGSSSKGPSSTGGGLL